MDLYWKAISVALVALLLALTLEKQGKDFALLLSVFAVCLLLSYAVRYYEPLFSFISQLESLGQLNNSMILVLLKTLGVGLTGEISAAVCIDSGNSSLGKGIQLLTNAAIFFLSVPVFSALIDLMKQIITVG